ncbi:MAG: biotin/lipoyl-binding protein, partial [Gemmatimonadota bacterium]|nr:biotin/lipoyl-binding protein [Gemmatimonadota bacterium]
YFVTVGSRELVIDVEGASVTVDGVRHEAHLGPIPGTPLRHLLLDDHSLTLAMDRQGIGEWEIAWRGTRHAASVIDERTRHIRSLTGGGVVRGGAGILKSPMPGLVVRVLVSAGQAVQAGQGLVVLEAMKMENELRAQAGGVVAAVQIQAGQAVEKGQVLIEFAAPSG